MRTALALIAILLAAPSTALEFEILTGGAARADAKVSPDGAVVAVAENGTGTDEVTRFASGSSSPLWSSPDGVTIGGVSNAGALVVGGSFGPGVGDAVLWSDTSGVSSVPPLAGDDRAEATDVSSDGSVVVGTSSNGDISAVYSLDGLSFIALPGIPSFPASVWANAISADGAVVVGMGNTPTGGQAFRWPSLGSAPDPLGFLPGGVISAAEGVSDDGSVVVGFSSTANGIFSWEAFRWAAGVMTTLGLCPASTSLTESRAAAVSGDGSLVVGSCGLSPSDFYIPFKPFVWTAATGLLDLEDVLEGAAVDLQGVDLRSATDVSSDGSVIVGTAWDPAISEYVAWKLTGLTFPPPGVPALPWLPALGLFGALGVIAGRALRAAGLR